MTKLTAAYSDALIPSPSCWSKARHSAIFLDKDGTLVQEVSYNTDISRIRVSSAAVDALRRLHAHGYRLIMVSNQAGVAHGLLPEQELQRMAQYFARLLRANGIPLHAFYWCAHHPTGRVKKYAIQCNCRKPKPGLLLKAAEECAIDLSTSWMIGDISRDIEAGKQAGCNTVLVDPRATNGTGSGAEFVVPCMQNAADLILIPRYRRNRAHAEQGMETMGQTNGLQ